MMELELLSVFQLTLAVEFVISVTDKFDIAGGIKSVVNHNTEFLKSCSVSEVQKSVSVTPKKMLLTFDTSPSLNLVPGIAVAIIAFKVFKEVSLSTATMDSNSSALKNLCK